MDQAGQPICKVEAAEMPRGQGEPFMKRALEGNVSSIVEENGSVMILVDPSRGEIVDANRAACAFYGYAHDELIGMNLTRINTLTLEEIGRALRQAHLERRSHFDFQHRLASGEVRDVEVYSSPVDWGGRPLLFSIVHDVTERKRTYKALQESEKSLKEGQQLAHLGTYALDLATGIWSASETLDEIFGINKGYEHTVKGWSALIHPDDHDKITTYFVNEVAGNGNHFDTEYRIIRKNDGAERWVHGLGKLELDARGVITTFRGTIQDITEEKKARKQLDLAAKVFAQASEGIVLTDAKGSILEVNEAFTRITGYTRDEVLSKNPRILNSGRQSKAFYDEMWGRLLEKGMWSGELWNRTKNGRVYAEALTITALRNSSGDIEQYIGLFSDVTPIKEQESKLENIARYDQMTGLPNKAMLGGFLHQALAHASRRGRMVTIVSIDLDKFKAINDRHGRSIGDQFLVSVARRMKLALRQNDNLAHLGGDEFVAVLPELANVKDTRKALAHLLKVASDPVEIGDLILQVSISAGVTYFPQKEEMDAGQLLRQANHAMCQAKQEGGNRCNIFDTERDLSVRERHESLGRIRQALEANEFLLYYQPKVNMSTGAVLGAEALIRWLHPERGLLPPAEFLPVIEGHPLASEIGIWVIDHALTQMEHWRADGFDIPVSVNIGAEQLQQSEFVDLVSSLLAAHPAIPPSMLQIEVLESSEFLDIDLASQIIRACQKLGVLFAFDDFGTGYASLAYLRKLPVDVIKIDQTFVREILDNPDDAAIVEAILAISTVFRCQTIAEGVETVEHGLRLLRLGCKVAQGYGIARPMHPRDLPAWASTWRPDPQWINVLQPNAVNPPTHQDGSARPARCMGMEECPHCSRQHTPAMDSDPCPFGILPLCGALEDGEVLAE